MPATTNSQPAFTMSVPRKTAAKISGTPQDAKSFLAELKANQSNAEREKLQRYFKVEPGAKEKDKFMGIRMGTLFSISKCFTDMPIRDLEKLLESDIHEVRAGAVSIMNQAAKIKKTSEARRKELFDLYLRRHDRINNWDLVDLGAIYAVGGYLADKPRHVLDKLALSKDPWQRRTAIIAPMYFILKLKETGDTFRIAEMLIDDKHELVQKAVGWGLRTAGDKDRGRLLQFLDKRAASMPRIMLRNAIEKLDAKKRSHYLNLK
jgi:3-methyladenine DNA glycosylase AlkD